MTIAPHHRNHRAEGLKSAATKGQVELDRAAAEAHWTRVNCPPGTRDVHRNPYSRQNFYPPNHPLHPK